jgi:hypothetical protein
MSSGLMDLTEPTHTDGIDALTAAAQGTKPWPDFVAELADLSGDQLKALVTAADAAATADPANNALRLTVSYAYAVYRDFQFSFAQGRFPYALGVNQATRGVYESGRINVDATA